MSSLQQRATSSSTSNSRINTNSIKKGAFESCFAQGLDLSEFDSANTPATTTTTTTTSAAAQLLPIIQRRAQERHSNDQEELKLHTTIQTRVFSIQNELKLKQAATPDTAFLGSHELTDALVTMHDNDHYGGANKIVSTKTMKRTNRNLKVIKMKPQHGSSSKSLPRPRQQTNNKAKTIAKKAMRAKYH
jgi:hypothetical protein